jgi:glycosyltransferase involved in cell wall biosynthesis
MVELTNISRPPLISVCIPTFNGSKTIRSAVQSVLSQTFTDFEIVICDDASADTTLSIVAKFDDPRIVVTKCEKAATPSANWNRAVRLCRADYIKVMGQDDVLYPHCLKTEMLAITQFADIAPAFVFSNRNIILKSGFKLKRSNLIHRKGFRPVGTKALLNSVIRSGRNPIGEPVAVTMRRDAFDQTSGFEGSYVVDLAMWFKLLEHGSAIKIHQVLSAFRISRSSWSFQLRKSQASETIELFEHLSNKFHPTHPTINLFVGKIMAHVVQIVRLVILMGTSGKKEKERRNVDLG